MNKSRESKNLIQTDISTAFSKWRHAEKIKMNKTKSKQHIVKSALVIHVHDSDSELDDENCDQKLFVTRKLPAPFPSDDEENITKPLECNERGIELHPSSTPKNITSMKLNKPRLTKMGLMASSTPLKSSNSDANGTHIVIENLSSISSRCSDTMSESGSIVSTTSESTIIYHQENSPNKSGKIYMKDQVIIPPRHNTTPANSSGSNTMRVHDRKKVNIYTSQSTGKKRTAESEKDVKRQKIHLTDSKERKLVKGKENLVDGRSKNKQPTNKISIDLALSNSSKSPNQANFSVTSVLHKGDSPNMYCGSSKEKSESKNKGNKLNSNKNETSLNSSIAGTSSYTSDVTRRLDESIKCTKQAQNNSDSALKSTTNSKCNKSKSNSEIRSSTSSNSSTEEESNCTRDVTKNLGKSMKCSSQSRNNKDSASHNKSIVKKNPLKRKLTNTEKHNETNSERNNGNNERKEAAIPVTSSARDSPKSIQTELEKESTDNSPKKKKINENGFPSCSQSTKKLSITSKIEGKKMNMKPLQLITDLFSTTYESTYLKDLIPADKEKIKIFLKMDVKYQYVCLKLFTRQRKWYNIFKLCDIVHLSLEDSDVCDLYNFFKKNNIVDTDYIKDDIMKLLYLLSPTDLKSICDMFKLRPGSSRKEDMINSLLKCCKTQSTLTRLQSTEDLIKEQIKRKMGKCIKLNEDFHDAFYRTYLLGTFTNPAFTKISDYFQNILGLNIVFPQYSIREHIIFYTAEEFIRYARARKCRDEIENAKGDHLETFKICKMVFMELKALKNIENLNDDRYTDAPHLIRFTAKAVYVSALSSAVKTLATKFPADAKQWLEYMILYESIFTHRIGEWYYHLTWLYMRYEKRPDYECAAKLLIKVLRHYRQHLSEVQLHQLRKRGELLKVTRKYKIEQWYHDKIAELVPRRIAVEELPKVTIDATAIRENESGRKRDYITYDKQGNKNILKVEEIALQHYLTNGYTGGMHCEGVLVKATFTLFFWDIIYMDIQGSFVSKIQSEPLDMHTKYFYLRRKDAIDNRLREIESEWSHQELVKWLNDNYDQHSHELGFCQTGAFINERELLEILVDCIGRQTLAKIYKRYVENIRHYRSGMPDLLVWNVNTKKSKFVEVKGENDKLSIGQTLWIKYLHSKCGADVEVCEVHSIGSKRKRKEGKASRQRCV